MCIRRGSTSFGKARKVKNGKQQQEIDCSSASAGKLYEVCLQDLKSKFQGEGKELFYQLFENTYKQICYKRRENKKHYWSKTNLVLLVMGTGGSGTIAAASLFSIVREFFSALPESDTLPAAVQSCAPLLLLFLLALIFLTACLYTEFKRRNYRDTWVRHSAAYHRLNIAMIRYLSDLTSREDFMKEVLRILEADIERFERNAGVAQGANIRADGTG